MMEWAALGDETVDLLRRYLMIDTTNPPGNEIAGTRFLADVLARDGIDSETIEAAPGRASLRARLPVRWLFAWIYIGLIPRARLNYTIEQLATRVLPRCSPAS